MRLAKAVDFVICRLGKKNERDMYPKQVILHLPWVERNEEWGAYCFGWSIHKLPGKGIWPPNMDYPTIFRWWGWLCFEYRDFSKIQEAGL